MQQACLLAQHTQACAPRLDIEVGHSATSASVRHSVWKRRRRSFSCDDRVGVALERCPGIPSFGRLALTRRGNLGICSRCGHERGRRNQSRGVHSWSKEAPPVVGRRRCGVRAASFFSRAHWAPTSERGWGASLNLTRTNSLDAPGRCGAGGADSERQRCHGRAARPRVRWFASRAPSASHHTKPVNGLLGAVGLVPLLLPL